MKRIPFLPSPQSLLSGALLFGLLMGLGAAASVLLPRILELLETNPRLAMIAIVALVTSPGVAVMIAHHFGNRSLDRFDANGATEESDDDSPSRGRRGILPNVKSRWAGAHAWLVLYGTSVLTSLVMLVIDPPPPQEPDVFSSSFITLVSSFSGAMHKLSTLSNAASLHSIVWIFIAAQLYDLERRAHRQRKKTGA